ncbi:MAG: glycosyltransferase [Parachlamydiaceae bacterium]
MDKNNGQAAMNEQPWTKERISCCYINAARMLLPICPWLFVHGCLSIFFVHVRPSIALCCCSFFITYFSVLDAELEKISSKKIIIVGVCQNVAKAVPTTIRNAEALGSRFADYAVVIYENNSTDRTVSLLNTWAQANPHVTFVTEKLQSFQLPKARTEKISRARNIALSLIRNPKFNDFEYTLMVDLDFTHDWPIEELMETLQKPVDWDCVAANGIAGKVYYDRYAFRNSEYPFGPELLMASWWRDLNKTWFGFNGEEWISVYSAFGGFAIYKTATITQFSYSGTVTADLKKYYETILHSVPSDNVYLKMYRELLKTTKPKSSFGIIFQENTPHFGLAAAPTCCEHLPLHASMALCGYSKFYVNPKMKIHYFR